MKKKKMYSKQQTQFVISITLIGVLFIASIVGILTGKFKPFASEESSSLQETGTPITVTGGTFTYRDSAGANITAPINDLIINVLEPLAAEFALQAIGENHDDLGAVEGQITALKAGGAIGNPSDVIASKQAWSTNDTNNTDTRMHVAFSNDLRVALDAVTGTAYDFVIKPKHYLARKITGISNLDQVIQFTPAETDYLYAGDLIDEGDDNYNKVNLSDFSYFISRYQKPIPDGTTEIADFNHDGAVDLTDWSIFIGNYQRSGDSL